MKRLVVIRWRLDQRRPHLFRWEIRSPRGVAGIGFAKPADFTFCRDHYLGSAA